MADSRSDIDLAISCDLPLADAERMRMYIRGRVSDSIDIHIFEHLPLYIQIRALQGKMIEVKDWDEVYDTAYRIMRQYEFFRL